MAGFNKNFKKEGKEETGKGGCKTRKDGETLKSHI